MKRVIVIVFLICFGWLQSEDSYTWIRTGGPPGGLGYDIRYHFDNPDIWYVTDNWAGVHMSTDNGATWQQANNGIPPQAGPTNDAIPIFCLTVDQHNPQILWAGTNPTGRIYRSTDGGLNWERRDNGITIDYAGGLAFRGFTVDPKSSDIVYAMGETSHPLIGSAVWGPGTGGVVFKTIDAGENWKKIWDGGMPSSLCRYLWVDPRDTDVLFVSTGIFDRGASGESGDPSTAEDPFGGLGILKSTDGGTTWNFLDKKNGLNSLYIGSLYMHPVNPDILLAGAGHLTPGAAADFMDKNKYSPNGVYRTKDGGVSWTQVLKPQTDVWGECFTAVEIYEQDPDIAYAGSEVAIYRSNDAGLTWTMVSGGKGGWGPPGITAGWPIDLQCDPRDPNRIFANNYNGGNFLSEDGGITWRNASKGYTGSQMRRVDVDPAKPARAYAAGRSGLWRTDDGGENWTGIFNPLGEEPIIGLEWLAIAHDSQQSNHVLAAHGDIIETYDGGSSWHVRWNGNQISGELSEGTADFSVTIISFAPSNSKMVYAGLAPDGGVMGHEHGDQSLTLPGAGLIVSQDGGTTWQRIKDAVISQTAIIDLAVDPLNANIVYAATATGLYQSVNGAEDWTLLTGYPVNTIVRAVAVNPNDSNHLLIGLEGLGIYMSENGGKTWSIGYAGLEANSSLHDIVFDPVNPEIAYTSDYYSGVYRSEDGGLSWQKINHGLRTRAAMGLTISSDGQHLYVATDGEGVFRLDVNGIPVGVRETEASQIAFHLEQNYPNPFNARTRINYSIRKSNVVTLTLYDIQGRTIRVLVNEIQNVGNYSVDLDGIDISSGIYFYQLQAGNQKSQTRKLLLLQ
ncbi:T9SS type A sorting domain-containing protein [bacterium]